MKTKFIALSMLFGLLSYSLPAVYAAADDDTSVSSAPKSKKGKKGKKLAKSLTGDDAEANEEDAADSPVAAILKQNTYFNQSEPNFKARYFIFLKSASWCGPCNMEMPKVAEAYKQMKASGKVELILLSHDQQQNDAEKFLAKYGATFPALMRGAKKPDMPPSGSIPHATIMDAEGNIIKDGHGGLVQDWKEHTIGKYAVIGDDGEPRVAKALKKIKFVNGKPSAKADFYFYLYEPQVDENTLASIASKVKSLKKAKFELIYLTGESSTTEVMKAMRKAKVKVPTAQASAPEVTALPGLGSLGQTAVVYAVTQSGAQITQGGTSILDEWEAIVEANKK